MEEAAQEEWYALSGNKQNCSSVRLEKSARSLVIVSI